MLNVKAGTQTWSKATPEPTLKSEPSTQNLSSPNRQASLKGEESVGDMLNKVADPNYVDPAKTRKVGNNQLDKDAFLKLMLTQMKYQDPTNPMKNHEMAAQLAQFTSLEQLNNINATLEGMKNQQSPVVNYQALNFIGKQVSGDSSKIQRATGDKEHDINFDLMADAKEVVIHIKDAEGNIIRKIEAANLKKGPNMIRWNGGDSEGGSTRPGEYKAVIEGKASNGMKVSSRTEFSGKITGVNYTPAGPVLLVGNQSINMKDVKKIVDPNVDESVKMTPLEATSGRRMIPLPKELQAQIPKPGEPAPTTNANAESGVAPQTVAANSEPPPAEEGDAPSNINKIPMNRGLYNQIKK